MNEQKIMDGLQDAVDAVDEPCFVLFCKGIEGESFFVENQKMADLSSLEKSNVYCGASIGLVSVKRYKMMALNCLRSWRTFGKTLL